MSANVIPFPLVPRREAIYSIVELEARQQREVFDQTNVLVLPVIRIERGPIVDREAQLRFICGDTDGEV